MKTLPIGEPFRPRGSDGWTLTILERVGDVALAEKTHPQCSRPAYEVAIVQRHESYKIAGQQIEAGESWPGSEAFGRLAWAPASLDAALEKFIEVRQPKPKPEVSP